MFSYRYQRTKFIMNYDKCISCKVSRGKSPEYKYFRFPKDEERCKKWILACNLKSLLNVPSATMYKRYRICSQHFKDADYISSKKKKLNSTACPSQFEFFENSIIISKLQEGLRDKLVNQSENSSCSIISYSKSVTGVDETADSSKAHDGMVYEDIEGDKPVFTSTPQKLHIFTEIESSIMPNYCAAYGCSNASNKASSKEKGISFHLFPLNDKDRLKLWLLRIRRKNFMPSHNSRLCSEHFTTADFEYQPYTNRRGLKNTAVPTKFCFTASETPERPRMPNICSAYGCSNARNQDSSKEKGVTFHHFPLNDKERLKLWLVKIGRKNFKPSPISRLCSEHFTDADFEYQPFEDRKGLKNTAIPTKFCFTTAEAPERPRTYEFQSRIVQHDKCETDTSSENEKSTQTNDICANHLSEIERLKTENSQLKTDLKRISEYLIQLLENQ